MNEAEFQAFHAQLRAINTVVASVDGDALGRFIEACDRADTLGAVMDPTAWMRGHENLRALVESARALSAHKRAIERLAGGR